MIIQGYELKVRPLSNIEIFNITVDIPEPKAPLFELEDGRVIENFHDPVYNHSIMLYSLLKSDAIFRNIVLKSVIDFNVDYIKNSKGWSRKWRLIQQNKYLNIKNEVQAFILYEIFTNDKAKELFVDEVVLTEKRVQKFFDAISVVRQGMDIKEAHVKHAINTGIEAIPVIVGELQIVSPLDEYKVASESGTSWPSWLNSGMSLDDKASAIALYRLDKLVHLHQEDAAQTEAEKKSKK